MRTPESASTLMLLQVPLRMATAFVKILHNPAASKLHRNVTRCFGVLARAVLESFDRSSSSTSSSMVSGWYAGSSVLKGAIRQQLQKAGLLQQLPAILDAATDNVTASAAQAQQQQPLGNPAQQLADFGTDETSDGVVPRAIALLYLYEAVLDLWAPPVHPEGWALPSDPSRIQSMGPAAPSALRLAAAVTSRCGWRCGSMPGPQLPPQAAVKLLPRFLVQVNAVAVKVCLMLQSANPTGSVYMGGWYLRPEPFVQTAAAE